ncbi:MAG: hypothetical protein CMD98_06570 [Gammaproteobacteria bacterium]|nr:hypothetical protein [Gammaproteobacteria bacterium]
MSEKIKDEVADETVVEETVEEVVETTSETETPLTKARTLSAIYASLQEKSKEELDELLEASKKKAEAAKAKAKTEDDDEDDEEDDDEEDEGDVEEGAEPKTKKLSKKKVKADDGSEGDVVEKKGKFKEDIDALAKGEESLSEGFKERAATIFEAALQEKTATKIAELEDTYASDLAEEVQAVKEDMVDKVDGYLNYVVENWMKENEVAIEHSLKSEITESFIEAMHGVFTEHYINVPEDKVEIVDALTEELTDAKDQLNKSTEDAKELSEKVKSFERQAVISEACEGLASTEAAKIQKLCDGIEADDNADFATKVATIKESYLSKDTATDDTEVDAISEDKAEVEVTDQMAKYIAAINKTK